MKIVINGMILHVNFIKSQVINFSDQESNVDNDGLIIQILVKKGIITFKILEVNGKKNKINLLLVTYSIWEEDGVIQQNNQEIIELNIW